MALTETLTRKLQLKQVIKIIFRIIENLHFSIFFEMSIVKISIFLNVIERKLDRNLMKIEYSFDIISEDKLEEFLGKVYEKNFIRFSTHETVEKLNEFH